MEDIKRMLVVSSMTKSSRKAMHYGVSLSKKRAPNFVFSMWYITPSVSISGGCNLPIASLEEEDKKIMKETKKGSR